MGGTSSDYIYSVIETADGDILAGGDFQGTILVENETFTSKSKDGIIIKYSNNGEVKWAKS